MMKIFYKASSRIRAFGTIVTLLVLAGLGLLAQVTSNAANGGNAAPPSVVRIVSPQQGQKLQQNAISVQYTFQPRQNAINPPRQIFQVQLDNRDPVQTEQAETTFTGLTPGSHTLAVQLVDANGVAVEGSRSQVQFTVMQQVTPPSNGNTPQPSRSGAPPQARLSSSGQAALAGLFNADQLGSQRSAAPAYAGAVPLVPILAIGALIGGLISARWTNSSR
ncbi:MAG TPA: hypothetical protein VE783_09730 [Candidatus Limnocylindrales bacterium]|jgi:hypothetical protein|nr:hypothetical protein [Candidatus Limnocylindrales bacterium]